MDTSRYKIIFSVSPLVIRNTFSVPVEFSQKSEEYNEEIIVQCFREAFVENKEAFFKAYFKPDTQLKNYPYPLDAEEFNEETHSHNPPESVFRDGYRQIRHRVHDDFIVHPEHLPSRLRGA